MSYVLFAEVIFICHMCHLLRSYLDVTRLIYHYVTARVYFLFIFILPIYFWLLCWSGCLEVCAVRLGKIVFF